MKGMLIKLFMPLFHDKNYDGFPRNLAEQLSITTPYTSEEFQPCIDFVKDKLNVEENDPAVKEICEKASIFAQMHHISLKEAIYFRINNSIAFQSTFEATVVPENSPAQLT